MPPSSLLRRFLPLLLALLALAAAGAARADPPLRAARIAFVDGAVSLSPADDPQWYAAPLNRPLSVGDRLWTEQRASAELQLGGAVVRIGERSDVSMLDFDDRIAQFRLSQGTLRLRVRQLEPGQAYEVATPNLAFTVTAPGDYRVDVDPVDDTTLVIVRDGQARVDGENNAYTIYAGRAYRFDGTSLRVLAEDAMPALDGLDLWARERDQRAERAAAAAWVSPGVIGYEDLDGWGSWRTDPAYGAVWMPTTVVAGWSPYVYGRWSWVAPWGWTWIDDAPWGFAVTHYGRWAHLGGRWCWVPGPRRVRAVYAPALVVFVGGSNFRPSTGFGGGRGVGWFPLGPREVYQPAYQVSRNYFTTINVSNTYVDTRAVHDVFDGRGRKGHVYVNRKVPGAVVAMPESGFARSQPVPQSMVRVRGEDLGRAQVTQAPAIAPARPDVRPDRDAGRAPPAGRDRPVIVRNPPPERGDRAPQPAEPVKGGRPESQGRPLPREDREDARARPEPPPRPSVEGGQAVPARPSVPDRDRQPARPSAPQRDDPRARPSMPQRDDPPARPSMPQRDDPPTGPSMPQRYETPARPLPREPNDAPVRRTPPDHSEAPTPQPRFEAPAPQPRFEAPPQQPRFEAPPQQRRFDAPAPQPRFEAPSQPQPQFGPPAQGQPRFDPPAQGQHRFGPPAMRPPAMPVPVQPMMPSRPIAPPELRAPQMPSERSFPQTAPQRAAPPQAAPQGPRQGFERRDRGDQQ
ncbi:DUF6600 domain-containing protein [Quisquiliibacterium transsilvanicum]|uniref:FecR protein domain-containing protein n=1 Tax=Quisquiliibacterium transsilvanicum TaxID=1549638 RepID=A0A7W8HLD2_9BURK|nr:DUF6600 domain-containing protein [Quisquiliibacterium transsilvanicum]MBB5273263.1 hypothetical protein [Quisquiliibacterium transsilvanicum]